jgi:cytochrome c-type biogenesis protein CcmH/NrfG
MQHMSDKTRRQMLEEMLAEDASDPFLHYGLAMEFVAAGEDAQAVQRFERLFEVAPDYVPAYLQAGQALVRLRRVGDARSVFERGIATAGRLGDAHAAEEMQGMLANLA